MLNMKETAIVVMISVLAAVLTAGLIRATFTYDVELVSSPVGPLVAAPAGRPFNVSCLLLNGDASHFSSMKWLGPAGNVVATGSEDDVLHLTFTNPKPEDSGTYKCEAQYARKYDLLYTLKIVFYGPAPVFDVSFENTTFREGERAELYCFARGETPMTYKWYNQSGDFIPEMSDERISVSSSSNGSWLFLREVKPFHEGMYTCNANNSHGLVSKLFHLGVSPRTGNNNTDDTRVQGDFEVVNVSSTSVRLQILNPDSEDYVEVKYTESRSREEFRQRFPKDPANIYNVENLIPGGLYTFRFRVSSSGNSTMWSDSIQVTLLPDVPEIILRRREKDSLEFEWFRKVDDLMRGTIDQHEIKYYSVSMKSGNSWIPSSCATTIQKPSCSGSSYIISGLQQNAYYVIELRAHTASGYGEAAKQKIFVPAW